MQASEPSFRPDETIFMPGAAGEPTALISAVFSAESVNVTTSFVPGINRLEEAQIGRGSRVSGLFMHASLASAQRSGKFRHLPMSYAAMIKHLTASPPFDTCVLQVSPPDASGNCSLGPAAEFSTEIMRRSVRIIASINQNVPAIRHAPRIAMSALEFVTESDTPLATYDVGNVDPTTLRIAAHISNQIGDGAVLQIGLGKVPCALLQALHDRRRLRLHSGMISDGVIGLASAGALDPDAPIVTTAVLGTTALYQWAATRPELHVRGAEYIHAPQVLSGLNGLFAVNSALEVDLFGQCNLELAAGSAVSGAGGAPDFARAARLSPGGASIVALPATFSSGRNSRICAILGTTSVVSLPRTDVDIVVTEEGAADLRGLSVHERAETIIEIAAPAFRSDLRDRWAEITRRL